MALEKKKKKEKGTQPTETLAQVVFWYKRGHSGPAGLFVSMVTDSCSAESEVKEGEYFTTGQVYIVPCNKGVGYGVIGKHSCLAGEQYSIKTLINHDGLKKTRCIYVIIDGAFTNLVWRKKRTE